MEETGNQEKKEKERRHWSVRIRPKIVIETRLKKNKNKMVNIKGMAANKTTIQTEQERNETNEEGIGSNL